MSQIKVKDIIDRFQLDILAGEKGIDRTIRTANISSPGLEMAGYFTYYPVKRIQIIGRTELGFFKGLNQKEREGRMLRLCQHETPCICISRGMDAPPELIEA